MKPNIFFLSALFIILSTLSAAAQKTIFSGLAEVDGVDRTFISSSMIRSASKHMKTDLSPEEARRMDYVEVVSSTTESGRKAIIKAFNDYKKTNPNLDIIMSSCSSGSKNIIYAQCSSDASKYSLMIIYNEEPGSVSITVMKGERNISFNTFGPTFSFSF